MSQYFIGLMPPVIIFVACLVSYHLRNGEKAISKVGAAIR
jgi:hypothetical protein